MYYVPRFHPLAVKDLFTYLRPASDALCGGITEKLPPYAKLGNFVRFFGRPTFSSPRFRKDSSYEARH